MKSPLQAGGEVRRRTIRLRHIHLRKEAIDNAEEKRSDVQGVPAKR